MSTHLDDIATADSAGLEPLERVIWLRVAREARRGRVRPVAALAVLCSTTPATIRTKLCSARRKIRALRDREAGECYDSPGEGYLSQGADLLTCVRNGVLEEKEILDRDGRPCGVMLAAAERGERLLPSATVLTAEDAARIIEAADRRRGSL